MSQDEINISHWDSFLSQEEYNFVWEEFEKHNWEYIAGEHDKNIPVDLRVFWFKNLIESKLEPLFRSKVEDYLKLKIRTNRLYGNGQAYGQDAFIHRDQQEIAGDTRVYGTLVYYLHKEWKPHYGGHLIFVDENIDMIKSKVIASIFPHTNSAVLFNSKIQHMAFSPSIYCTDMRLSIGYKFCISQNQE